MFIQGENLGRASRGLAERGEGDGRGESPPQPTSVNLFELRPAQMLTSAGNDSFRGRGRLRLQNERTKTVLRGPRERKSNPRRRVSRCSQSFFNRNRPRTRPRPRFLPLPPKRASISANVNPTS